MASGQVLLAMQTDPVYEHIATTMFAAYDSRQRWKALAALSFETAVPSFERARQNIYKSTCALPVLNAHRAAVRACLRAVAVAGPWETDVVLGMHYVFSHGEGRPVPGFVFLVPGRGRSRRCETVKRRAKIASVSQER